MKAKEFKDLITPELKKDFKKLIAKIEPKSVGEMLKLNNKIMTLNAWKDILPYDPTIKIRLGELENFTFQTREEYETAKNVIKRVLQIYSESGLLWADLATCYIVSEKYDKGINACLRALHINENNRYVYGKMLTLYTKKGDYDNAIKMHRIYLLRQTKETLYQVAFAYFKKGDFSNAKKMCEKSLKEDNNFTHSQKLLKDINEKLKN